jgi:hypothetical protein
LRYLAAIPSICYKAVTDTFDRENIMEQNTPPTPDPAAVTPQHADTTSTQITSQPPDDPRWARQTPDIGGSSALPVLGAASFISVGMCLLGMLVGTWILPFVGFILLVCVFHYFTWGWVYTRMVSAQQKEELLRLAEQDAKLLSDPQRSQHI